MNIRTSSIFSGVFVAIFVLGSLSFGQEGVADFATTYKKWQRQERELRELENVWRLATDTNRQELIKEFRRQIAEYELTLESLRPLA
ncbi:MAG: hypothetical protein ABGX07_12810, partial [Pirellulaceae bacterium]